MMKGSTVFVLALAIAVANVQAEVQPYVVPIYRVTKDATTTTTDPTATTTTTPTTTPTTTTPTTTVSVETTPTTSQKPTVAAALDAVGNFFEVKHMRHPRSLLLVKPLGLELHTFVHVCSGTLVDATAVITTVSCIEMATTGTDVHPYVGTAEDDSSEDSPDKVLYEVNEVIRHPDYDMNTNVNNIAILKLADQVAVTKSGKVSQVPWAEDVVAVDTKCITSYWGAATPFAQVNQDVTVKACSPVKDGAICSTFTSPPAQCPAGANGGSLVCDSKLAGIFTAHRNADCSAALWQYEELSKDADWIWMSVSAAPILNVSFAAILVLVAAMLKSL